MIFKVFFQKSVDEAPVREYTQSIYLEADSERDVRKMLAERHYNIEFITKVTGPFLEYEQKREDFKVKNV